MQMISCLTSQVTMADEISPGMSDRAVVGKISQRKHQERHCVTPSLPDGQILINTNTVKTDSSFGGIFVGMNSFSESSDTGILYLNPLTPKWSLVEKFAELSPGEETGINDDEDSSSEELLQCTKYIEKKNKNGSNEVLLDAAQKERNCSKYLKNNKIQSDASVKHRTPKLKELNVEEYSPGGDGNETKKKNVNSCPVKKSLKKSVDDKIPRLLVAMKKRGGVDTEQRPFKCTHCHWAFKKFCNLQSHLQTHSGLKPHVCDICGKAYSHQGTLQQHKRLHTGERPYHCPFCVKTYIWSSDYRKHIRTHTGEKPYVCDTCGKDFIRSSDLRKHERNMHTNNKPFPCTHCGKTFNKPLSLKRHERKHLGERPFSCPDCGKAFALASRMAEHQKIHTGVRPYVCSVCSKCFTKSSNLTEHEAIHSGARPHKCPECGVAFAMASRLVRHQYIHNKEKLHSCTGCSKNFSNLATLKLHQEQSCAGRIFVCVQCDKSFQCASKLAQHIMNHKNV
ncbi:zinc finger protein 648 [Dicentrarchus labrax]|uniref:zinc finger protein 648 n=1 Tax=Dicentrarchus labrax TaxID=13489 RepID=UPI0021F59067|nr:zinc finger protein 648 [Dicentrarchus labrax]XP_051233277.1 zinc finger protein 648 [Dicentrarchus labrax]XP_051233278.1 zinc finger protein 648 [Dicentrarchus labrax]